MADTIDARDEARLIEIDSGLLLELHRGSHGPYPRLVTFLGLYTVAAWSAYTLAEELPLGMWTYPMLAPIILVAAASLHGISLFTHEGVHGTLSRDREWNRWLSILCALPVLQNYSAYRVLHLRHHLHLGREGDPDYYPNYTSWTWLEFLMHWGRLLIGYPAYIIAIPILGFRQGTRTDRCWIVLECSLLALGITVLILSPIPRAFLLWGWVLPMVVINTLVNIRGMSQHTFLEHHTNPILGTRSILTNPLTAFFMCNENYHLEHHLFPGVPWYNLPKLHSVLRPQLKARGAPFIPSYFAFVREFIAGSFRRSPFGQSQERRLQ